jgi:hypothetical protein
MKPDEMQKEIEEVEEEMQESSSGIHKKDKEDLEAGNGVRIYTLVYVSI